MKSLSRALAFAVPFATLTAAAPSFAQPAQPPAVAADAPPPASAPPVAAPADSAPADAPPPKTRRSGDAHATAGSGAASEADALNALNALHAGDAPPGDAPPPVDVDIEHIERAPDLKERLTLRAGPLHIAPVVLLQVQAIPYVGADSTLQAGDPADRAGFRLLRARFGFEGRMFHHVPFEISAEFSSDEQGTARLHDAWFGYDRFRFLQLFVGAHSVPFSRYAMTGSGSTSLTDRPLAVRSLAPFHQLGIHAEGHFHHGAFNYFAGVYNGLQRTDQFFLGYVENAGVLGNRWDGLTYAGRLTTEPMGHMGPKIQDFHHSKFKFGLGASGFFSNGGTRNILGVGGDALLHVAGVHVLGEFLMNQSSPKDQPTQTTTQTTKVTSLAAVAEAGYMILPERLGVTARFEWLKPNTAVSNESDNVLITGGLSYHLFQDTLKTQLEYTHREELHGKSLKNDSVVLQFQFKI